MRRKQTGFFLVSATVAVAVLGMVLTFWSANQARQARVERAEQVGEAMKAIGEAAQSFITLNYREIDDLLNGVKSEIVLGSQNDRFTAATHSGTDPYIEDLTATRLLAALNLGGMGSRPPHGVGEYVIRVSRVCDQSRRLCNLESLIYLSEPMKRTDSSAPDFAAAAIAVRKIGSLGGLSTADNPNEFRFVDGEGHVRPIDNPLRSPGLIAVRGRFDTSALNVNVSRDGRRGPLNDMNFEHVDNAGMKKRSSIVGLNNIVGTGKLSMNELEVGAATIKGTLNLDAGADAAGGKRNQDIVGAGNIDGNGKLTMNGIHASSAQITGSASIDALTAGALTAERGATIEGVLRMQNNNIESVGKVTAAEVESRGLKSTSGVVELKKEVPAGSRCDVWGLGRDSGGRIMSCQRDPKNPSHWKWMLASTPRTVNEVPDDIIKEVLRGNGWKMYKFALNGRNAQNVRPADEKKKISHFIVSAADACTLDPMEGPPGDNAKLERYWRGFKVSGGGSDRSLICFTKGFSDGSIYRENSRAYWRVSANVYNEDNPEFKSTLAALLLRGPGPTLPPPRARVEFRDFKFDRFKYLAGDAGHHYSLGDWERCIKDHSYGNAWAGSELTLYEPGEKGFSEWVLRVKKRDGRALCWKAVTTS
ncbi:hypothetical protein PHO31112_02451 [Pandoraea horticolens]|uniref:Uncharacterized protein n=1 Tax=Pandoraea horticolens TaxID=2508298 RepID=A0A5E4V5D0_9BURK|nr:hypothetical protein [Pandoraea horticolens]VVE07467.1 hypothetical protein PHO31112_02451 [Pandoraea horticolens]